jgi:hypothetical protein
MDHCTSLWDDPALAPLLAAVQADPESEGLLLGGSRGAGVHDHESDYDLEWVLSDAAYDRRLAAGELMHQRYHPLDPRFDVSYSCPRELAAVMERASWELPAYATTVVLVDCHGRLAPLLQAMATMPAERADAEVLAWFDGYLNAFYRSLKAWRRGNALGGQLQAAESVTQLVKVLFALERRWPPYHDRLATRLADLDGQGWPPGYLVATLLRIAQTGDPTLQQDLEARAEALVRSRGYAVDLWDGEIARVKAWSFAGSRT